jgi:hypothetical protein
MPVQHVKALIDEPEHVQPEVVPIVHGAFTLFPTGLVVRGEPSYNEWAEVGHVLNVMEQGIAFLVGDWIRYGEERFKELAYQVIDARHWKPETVRNYVWVSKNVPIENRIISHRIKFAHHQIVASLPPAEQKVWLKRALNPEDEEEGWSVQRLRQAIKAGGDIDATGWYVLVSVDSKYNQEYLMKELNEKGYRVKAVTKRRP